VKYIARSLRLKLTLALLFTSLSGVIIVAVLVQQFTATEFDNFIVKQQQADFVAEIVERYEEAGSWENMEPARGEAPPGASSDAAHPGDEMKPPSFPVKFVLVDLDGQVIISDDRHPPGQPVSERELDRAEPVVVDGETVGYVLASGNLAYREAPEEAFLERINLMLLIATVGVIALALMLSMLLARSLSKPLREIAVAIQSMARGNLEQQVPVRSRDEVGQLAVAFNQMSADLARSNQLRRQMTADIAHELGTPLSVVVGYLESLSEGLLKPNRERFKIMNHEAKHLQHLVEDLRVLSLADAGELPLNLQWIDPNDLVGMAAAAFNHQAKQHHITLAVQSEPEMPLLYADPDRMMQVFSNLISNALRYTPEHGQITLSSRVQAGNIVLGVRDTGKGISPEQLPLVFERFYRGDPSRHQEQSESGLGLAIAKSAVEAQGGAISVSSVVGEGTVFTMSFPAKDP
jgi:two-component system, OmpR family, sensor histidine kinase BaeS